ncbi:SDR family NAD(P)-dependent oxidoreductase [Streptomyces sp. NPDC058231]|uniref:SDR family NAD(P)-dependent oxidoreductase n=1 Tax=Streptomyces sp. NPDC058231 TaxID=3346392 RepID=UPI0036E1FFF6
MATWFVTCASRGIGTEITSAAPAGGNNVVVAVRNPERVPDDMESADKVFPVTLDVTDNDSIPQAGGGRGPLRRHRRTGEQRRPWPARRVGKNHRHGGRGAVRPQRLRPDHVTRAVLPVMRKQGSGRLVHIGSRSGLEGEPGVSLYCASKFAVAGISEALSLEMAPFGIESMVVEPGVFRTDILDASSLSVAADHNAVYDDTPAHATLGWIDRANNAQLGDPAKGAALIVEGASAEKLPTHLYLGRDTLERLDVKYRQVQNDLAPGHEKSAAAHDDAA